jgi:hypothetical protein
MVLYLQLCAGCRMLPVGFVPFAGSKSGGIYEIYDRLHENCYLTWTQSHNGKNETFISYPLRCMVLS